MRKIQFTIHFNRDISESLGKFVVSALEHVLESTDADYQLENGKPGFIESLTHQFIK